MKHTKMYERNGHWVLCVKDDNTGNYKQLYRHKDKAVIKKKRAAVQSDSIDAQTEFDKRTFVNTYQEFAQTKLDQANHPNAQIRIASVECYMRYYMKWIKPCFNHRLLLKEISCKVVEDFFQLIKDEKGATWKTAHNVAKTFYTCFKYAVENQYIKLQDIEHLNEKVWKIKKKPHLCPENLEDMKTKKTPMISREEALKLFEYFNPPTDTDVKEWQKFAVVSFFIFTGVRMSELRGLRWDHVNLKSGKFHIEQTVVESHFRKSVKAESSDRINLLHPELWKILIQYRSLLSKYFTPRKLSFVFPSLRQQQNVVIPLCDRSISDWLKIAFHNLGFAKIKIHKNPSGDSKHYVTCEWNKFGGAITKTFRHFASTCLRNAKHIHPSLTDNFRMTYIGHSNIKMTDHYANHNNLDTTLEYEEEQRLALSKAIALKPTKSINS